MEHGTLICLAGMILATVAPNVRAHSAAPAIAAPSVAVLLARAEGAKSNDQDRYRSILVQLHERSASLSVAQRWHLRLLDAQQLSFDGNYGKADPLLYDIVAHSGDQALSIRAMARLVQNKFNSHHYVDAYTLANTLMAELPKVADPTARLEGMDRVIIMLNGAAVGQYELALQYAREMKATLPSAAAQCIAEMGETNSLLYEGKLLSTDPRFRQAIDTCLAAKHPLSADSLRLNQASAMIDEGRAKRAIAFLHRIAPAIRKNRYPPYLASLQVTLAQAYLSLGDAANARKFALTTTAMSGANSTLWILQAAYEVLYKAEKMSGHAAAALAYYEKYVALDKAAVDHAKARALAYQMVKQQVQSKKLKLDALDKQNRILQLRHALAVQSQKASRLYIALLLVVIAFIAMAMFWLRRSQLRFRKMARYDGLTGVFNREHFFEEAGHALRRLHRAKAGACLVILDLDHFKRVNDSYGHVAGDVVLRQTVAVCLRELRKSDMFGRLGGEEFGILMPVASREQGVEIASRIRCALAAEPMVVKAGITITVSASFGVAWSADSGRSLRDLLIDADAALYRAKDGGRNRVAVDTRADLLPEDPEDAQLTCNA